MKNYNIHPDWRGAGVERYKGPNRRDTRRVRTKIYNFLRKGIEINVDFTYKYKDNPTEYLPFGLMNSWSENGFTITPMWVRPVPLNSYAPWFVLLYHDETDLVGWYECYKNNDSWNSREQLKLPSGDVVFGLWVNKPLNWHLYCCNFYRPYEEPTKDLDDFDTWHSSNCPYKIAEQIIRDTRDEWNNFIGSIGSARIAYEKGVRLIKKEVLEETIRRNEMSHLVGSGHNTAAFNQRQLRAFGIVA